MQPTDEALVLACRKGDQAAWEVLIARYQRLIYSIPRRAGLDENTCADVFQQVFATLVQHLDHIERPERIAAWLATTARRESWRVSRIARSAQSLSNHDSQPNYEDNLPDEAPLPEEQFLRSETQQQVHEAVGMLDERCSVLLTLLFYRDDPPPYSEIAQMLGTSEGSIGPTRARCLQKLRRLLVHTE